MRSSTLFIALFLMVVGLRANAQTVDSAKVKGVEKSLAGNTLTVPDDVLQSYTGEYELVPEFSITVTREGNHLYGQGTGQPRFELFPESQTKFFLKVVDAKMEFFKDDKGQVVKAILYQNGEHEAKKIK